MLDEAKMPQRPLLDNALKLVMRAPTRKTRQPHEIRHRPTCWKQLLLGSIAVLLSPGGFWSQIADEAADADSKADNRILQRHDCSRTEEAQCRQRPHAHDP